VLPPCCEFSFVDIHASEARLLDNWEVHEEFDKDEHYFGPY
jgi:hypothetical protein